MLMAAGCLINITQSSSWVSAFFRENEGITTVMSLLESELQSSPVYTPSEPLLRASSEQSPVPFFHLDRKVVVYLTGILINVSKSDPVSSNELAQLRGMEVMTQLLQVTQEKQSIYCLECINACCQQDPRCKVRKREPMNRRTRWEPAAASSKSSTASCLRTST